MIDVFMVADRPQKEHIAQNLWVKTQNLERRNLHFFLEYAPESSVKFNT